ncbi:MAG: hypothetical protein FJX20_20320 [Alphaproteobacteria bacterium]|nr:hypothetical protein [Alphaproteobacteria bacterium]
MPKDGDTHYLGRNETSIPESLREVPDLKLRIWNMGFKRFEELARFPNLAELTIMDFVGPSFAPLAELRALRLLSITHFPKVHSLAPLAGLASLQELTLQTLPSWDASRKHQVVESFQPLSGLTKLKKLVLSGVRAEDGDLSPLHGLVGLEQLAIGNIFSQVQFARLAAKVSLADPGFLAPFLRLDGYACRKCGTDKVMLSGADVPNPKIVCPTCHKRKVDETVARFEQLRLSA